MKRVLVLLALLALPAQAATIRVTWRAVGDDSLSGTATRYDLRLSTSPIDEGNFLQGSPVQTPAPAAPGTLQEATATGLEPGVRYYLAIKAQDDAGNWSGISNVATRLAPADTLIPPPPPAYRDSVPPALPTMTLAGRTMYIGLPLLSARCSTCCTAGTEKAMTKHVRTYFLSRQPGTVFYQWTPLVRKTFARAGQMDGAILGYYVPRSNIAEGDTFAYRVSLADSAFGYQSLHWTRDCNGNMDLVQGFRMRAP